MARFVNGQVPEVVQPFWAALQRGEFIADAAVQVGTYRKQGTRWVAACGGVRPRRGRNLKGRTRADQMTNRITTKATTMTRAAMAIVRVSMMTPNGMGGRLGTLLRPDYE